MARSASARIWHAGMRALRRGGGGGRDVSCKELVWREFAYHLMYHTPHIATRNWRADWDGFPWRGDNADAERWRRGMTGEPFVDAAMREMYVTGTMHNRARMIVASYLTKHLMTALAGGAGLVRRLPDRLGPGGERDGLAMGGGLGPGCGALFPHLQPGDAGREVRSRRRAIAGASSPNCRRAPGPRRWPIFDAVPRSWGLDPQRALSGARGRSGRGPRACPCGICGTKRLSMRAYSGSMTDKRRPSGGTMDRTDDDEGPDRPAALFCGGLRGGAAAAARAAGFRAAGWAPVPGRGARSPGRWPRLQIHNPDTFARLIREGDLGFCDAYLEGWWSTPDLQAFMDLIHDGQ